MEAEPMQGVLPQAPPTQLSSTVPATTPANLSRSSLCVGDINGQLPEFFAKLKALNVKHNFAFAIIVGNLFAHPDKATDKDEQNLADLIDGKIAVSVPTYFALPRIPLPDSVNEKLNSTGGELCPNLSVLGRRAQIKTTEGFRIVALGGAYNGDNNQPPNGTYDPTYNDTDALMAGGALEDCDILVTPNWPANVRDGSKQANPHSPRGLQCIANLCARLKPRYHFSTSGFCFEREPFFHNGPAPRFITRFISLADFQNAKKEKFMYAFQLEPAAAPPQTIPDGCTASPLVIDNKRKRENVDAGDTNFRYGNGHHTSYGGGPQRGPRRGGRGQARPVGPGPCYFCLSNQEADKHMIGSIGDNCYMTIARGPLTTKETFPDLGIPGHMLIAIVPHEATLSSMEASERDATTTEMERYRANLNTFLTAKTKDATTGLSKLGSVTWEISRAAGMHLHWQYLPVPVDLIQKGLVEAAFRKLADNLSYPRFAKDDEEAEWAANGDYFRVKIWSEGLVKEMIMPFDQNIRFDLQFGRRAMAKLLGLESREHWKDCVQTLEEESRDAEVFKEMFREFDWAMQAE